MINADVIYGIISGSERALTRLADMPVTRYNKSRLLIDGHETFRSIFEGIESAEQYILEQFFILTSKTWSSRAGFFTVKDILSAESLILS